VIKALEERNTDARKHVIVRLYWFLNYALESYDRARTDRERLGILTNYYLALAFFRLLVGWQRLAGWLTNFYPFSLIGPQRLNHAGNKAMRQAVERIEAIGDQVGLSVLIASGEGYPQFMVFKGLVSDTKADKEKRLSQLKEALAREEPPVYLTWEGDNLSLVATKGNSLVK